jgi:hypothetical protein
LNNLRPSARQVTAGRRGTRAERRPSPDVDGRPAAENRRSVRRFARPSGGAGALAACGWRRHPAELPLDLDVTALERSFDLIAPRGDELVDASYARLFAAAPAVRPLFEQTGSAEVPLAA